MNSVRILNLNIWNYNEPWEARRERIVDLIQSTLPDLVALQEVRGRDWGPDVRHQADQILARLPGYSSVWEPAHYWAPGEGHNQGRLEWEGLAILSAHPLLERAAEPALSRQPADAARQHGHPGWRPHPPAGRTACKAPATWVGSRTSSPPTRR